MITGALANQLGVSAIGNNGVGYTAMPGAGGGFSFGSLSLGFSIGNAIGSVVGAFIAADTASYVLKKQAESLEIQSAQQQLRVEGALRAGEAQVGRVTANAGAIKAKQKVTMAANGVQLGVGSSAELLTSTDVNKELDVKAIQENALNAAWGYQSLAGDLKTKSAIAEMGSQYKKDTAVSSTIGTAIESIGQVAPKWYAVYGR